MVGIKILLCLHNSLTTNLKLYSRKKMYFCGIMHFLKVFNKYSLSARLYTHVKTDLDPRKSHMKITRFLSFLNTKIIDIQS